MILMPGPYPAISTTNRGPDKSRPSAPAKNALGMHLGCAKLSLPGLHWDWYLKVRLYFGSVL